MNESHKIIFLRILLLSISRSSFTNKYFGVALSVILNRQLKGNLLFCPIQPNFQSN
jgi:hypothetical protein